MKPAIKWGIAAVSGIALFTALKKMSDANAEETARTQAELKQTREEIKALQANAKETTTTPGLMSAASETVWSQSGNSRCDIYTIGNVIHLNIGLRSGETITLPAKYLPKFDLDAIPFSASHNSYLGNISHNTGVLSVPLLTSGNAYANYTYILAK